MGIAEAAAGQARWEEAAAAAGGGVYQLGRSSSSNRNERSSWMWCGEDVLGKKNKWERRMGIEIRMTRKGVMEKGIGNQSPTVNLLQHSLP